jgi:hypothetical protein
VDAFSYGRPTKGRAPRAGKRQHVAPEQPRVERSAPKLGKPVMVAAGLALAAALVFGLFQVVKSGGEAVADTTATDLHQADAARDAEAQTAAHNAEVAAKVAFTDSGSYAGVTPLVLAKIEPSFQYISGASTGSSVVSVATTPTDLGLAVMSGSGTCFYVHLSEAGSDAFGSGQECTGSAALAASGPSF